MENNFNGFYTLIYIKKNYYITAIVDFILSWNFL